MAAMNLSIYPKLVTFYREIQSAGLVMLSCGQPIEGGVVLAARSGVCSTAKRAQLNGIQGRDREGLYSSEFAGVDWICRGPDITHR